MMRPWRLLALGMLAVAGIQASHATAQALDDRLDDEQFVRGLSELRLRDVLEHYIATHPTDDPVRSAEYEMARQRIALNEPGQTSAQRLAAVQQLLNVRSELIANRPADERRAVWLADQAADLLFELLPIDAAGLTTIVGVPGQSLRERASDTAKRAHAAASQAELEIERSMISLESKPGFANDLALQQRRHRLNEQERQRRIPFLRGIAACLQAELNATAAQDRASLYTIAADVLPSLAPMLEGPAAAQARLYAALALMRLDRFDQAEVMLSAVTTHQTTSAADMFFARMLSVMNRAARSGPEAALELLATTDSHYAATEAFYFRLLIADRCFLLRRALAAQMPAEQRGAAIGRAYATYTELLDNTPGIPREAVRAAIFARLADAPDPGAAIESLPTLVQVARADQLSRTEDPQSLQQAVAALDRLLASGGLDAFEQAAALFAKARAQYALGERLTAAKAFLELADRFAGDMQAERAIELAASIAAEAVRAVPEDPAARPLLEHALSVLLSRYPNLASIDRWRLVAAQVAMDDRRFGEAITALSAVPRTSPYAAQAQYSLARAALQRALLGGNSAAERQLFEEAVAYIETASTAIATSADSHSDSSTAAGTHRAMLDSLRAMKAEALLGLKQPERALEAVATIEREEGVDRAALAEALRVRIAAYQSLNQPEKAAAEIRQYLQAAPEQALGVIAPMMEALQMQVQMLVESGQDDRAREVARSALQPVARLVEEHIHEDSAQLAADDPALAQRVAEAHRLAGDHAAALNLYERLLARQPDVTLLVMGRAECLFHLGGEERLAEAMSAYKRIAAAGPSSSASSAEGYWLAQLRMLQILDSINRNTSQILPRIERLRQQDATFGGERFRRGFDSLRQKYLTK